LRRLWQTTKNDCLPHVTLNLTDMATLITGKPRVYRAHETDRMAELDGAELGLGFLQYFIHPNRRTVHDRIAETSGVREKKSS